MEEVVIVSACRTAVGAFGGTLRDMNAAVIGSVAMKEAIKRAGIEPGMIDDVRLGIVLNLRMPSTWPVLQPLWPAYPIALPR